MPGNNQSGIIHIVIPVILLIVIIGSTGFFVISRRMTVNTTGNTKTGFTEATQSTQLTAARKDQLTAKADTQASVSAESKEWKRYADNKSGISILFPHDWHHQDGLKFHEGKYLISSLFLNDALPVDKTNRKIEINVYPQSLDEVKKLLNYQHDFLKVELKIAEIDLAGHKALKTELQDIKINVPNPDEDMGAGEKTKMIKEDPNKLNYFISIDEKSTVELSYGTESAEIVEQMVLSLTFK